MAITVMGTCAATMLMVAAAATGVAPLAVVGAIAALACAVSSIILVK